MQFTLQFETQKISGSLEEVSLEVVIRELSEYFATHGALDGAIFVTDAECGNILSIFHSSGVLNFEKLVFENGSKLTFEELLEIPQYISTFGNLIKQESAL